MADQHLDADRRADDARQRMVDHLSQETKLPQPILDALRRVPRHRFLDPMWAAEPGVEQPRPRDLKRWRTVGDDVDDHALDVAYSAQLAVAILPPEGSQWPTSTASAPGLVADMLDLLELQPGMRVLEIGVGSGYNAALLAEVLGDQTTVTSIDIDDRVIERARNALLETGYGGVTVIEGDGFIGCASAAPFDRIIVTVGTPDLSPHWLEQLTPEGMMLVPLEHGGVHPILRAGVVGDHAVGTMVAPSGFVRVQGALAATGPWPHAHTPIVGHFTWTPLGADVVEALRLRPKSGEWDLGYFIALADRRAAQFMTLVGDDGSGARINRKGEVGWTGPTGKVLRDDLLDHASAWLALGAPATGDYRSEFIPLSDPGWGPEADHRWVVDRMAFRQVVTR
jgi:protein-L-isoaspartate(D-aspartate) O-methyltransferase